MKLLADENISASLVHALRSQNNDVAYVAELSPGLTDDEVLSLARQEERVLLTEDKDFGDLVFRLKQNPPGIILLRVGRSGWQAQRDRLDELFARHPAKLSQTYTVVGDGHFRFRPLR